MKRRKCSEYPGGPPSWEAVHKWRLFSVEPMAVRNDDGVMVLDLNRLYQTWYCERCRIVNVQEAR